MKINLVDDFQANSIPIESPLNGGKSAIKLVLVDDYLSGNVDESLLYEKYDPSDYDNLLFVINIEDDFAKAHDEYVLITEDGFVISLEDYNNQDEIAIVVR